MDSFLHTTTDVSKTRIQYYKSIILYDSDCKSSLGTSSISTLAYSTRSKLYHPTKLCLSDSDRRSCLEYDSIICTPRCVDRNGSIAAKPSRVGQRCGLSCSSMCIPAAFTLDASMPKCSTHPDLANRLSTCGQEQAPCKVRATPQEVWKFLEVAIHTRPGCSWHLAEQYGHTSFTSSRGKGLHLSEIRSLAICSASRWFTLRLYVDHSRRITTRGLWEPPRREQ